MNLNSAICKSFNKQACYYEKSAKIQHVIGQRLFERLSYLKMEPKWILDLGCGTGYFSAQLKKRYPKAKIVSFDLSSNMLTEVKSKQSWRRRWSLTQGDMINLPFADMIFDLVFSNQAIHWSHSIKKVFSEVNRVMKQNGCFMFTTLGPDSFKEMKQAWDQIDPFSHVNDFVDMHDIGDWLLHEFFLDPVMDMEQITVQYETVLKLVHSLKNQGVKNIHQQRPRGLMGKRAWKAFLGQYEQLKNESGKYPLSYEVVYGHAWKGNQRKKGSGHETMIPVSVLRQD